MRWVCFHKSALIALSALCFLIAASRAAAQQDLPVHQVRAVIADLRSARQAHEVDLALRTIPGVRMSRTDYNTRNILLEVAADCAITREAVQALLVPHALTVTCWSRGPQGSNDHIPLNPRTCSELQPIR